MAIAGQELTVFYVAWDTAANAPITGDVSNHSICAIDSAGYANIPSNSPWEPDSINAPGVYAIYLEPTETMSYSLMIAGQSSTADVIILPVYVTLFDRDSLGIANAVWGAVPRTLTDQADSPGITTLLNRLPSERTNRLDHLADIAAVTTKLNGMVEDVSGNRFTQKALEQAPVGGGGGGDCDPIEIANAVVVRLAGKRITLGSGLLSDGTIEIVQGDDFELDLTIHNYDGPDVAEAEAIVMAIMPADAYHASNTQSGIELAVTATVDGDDAIFHLAASSGETIGLTPSYPEGRQNYVYQIRVTGGDSKKKTVAMGEATIIRGIHGSA